jgi:hypothetical protein
MANTDNPMGFRFYRDLTSGDCPQVRHFDAATPSGGGALELFIGQPVKLNQTTGYLVPLNGTIGNETGATGSFVGICTQYCSAAEEEVVQNVPVILAHTAEFIVQDDAGGSTVTSRATFYSHYMDDIWWQITGFASGNSSLGHSIAELAGTTGAATAGYLKVTDWHRVADNEFGDNMDLIVRFNPVIFQAGPYTLDAGA